MNEFELISRYFARQPVARSDVALGIGDDAAVLDVPAGQQLVVSTDMLVAGVHFP
ncbi:MAG: AIR synthase related protein, partial [Pseudomonadota bacterium]